MLFLEHDSGSPQACASPEECKVMVKIHSRQKTRARSVPRVIEERLERRKGAGETQHSEESSRPPFEGRSSNDLSSPTGLWRSQATAATLLTD
ncbi:hypothetical protein DPEC_G00019600 [Dallia pectoralis]|uniref:Uncharacterized protein n=1 Tax=Dallia pectoralis TaxID=75939 RepID=A0ACC2HFS3_DALPE|nr:hypothetical protein DPEC_G00019600 [Dallia pectoralis]